MNKNLREFTKYDWYGLAGASSEPGKPPLIRDEDVKGWFGVVDVHGIEIFIGDENDTLMYTCSYEEGIDILSNIPEELTPNIINLLKRLGFKEV